MSDIFEENGEWYYWDEAGLDSGPFKTKKQAEQALDAYIKYIVNKEEKEPIRKMREDMGL